MNSSDNIQHKFTYGKAEHLKSRKAIEQLFKGGTSFFIHPYKVFFRIAAANGATASPPAGNPGETSQLLQKQPAEKAPPVQCGFAASSRNFKKAVDRNRIKRLGREAYRLNKADLVEALLLKDATIQIFFVFTDKTLPTFDIVQRQLKLCLARLVKQLHGNIKMHNP